jgi:ankyrin repeat protein
LLECEADENYYHSTPINLAADLDTSDMLEFYLVAGADINKKDSKGHFPLWKSVRNGNYANAQIILEKGKILQIAFLLGHILAAAVLVDLSDNSGVTSLHASCTAGEVALSKLLIEYGASPNVRDENGDTALHHAAQIQVQR